VFDLVLAIDGSGSVKEDGFDTIKNFTGELVKKFRGDAYKNGAMKVGVVQFGNKLVGLGLVEVD
jgi:uncharacterized protein YegL